MNDKELVEAAAKASGWVSWDWLAGEDRLNVYDADGRHDIFNPLHDDGDALRLAVKLQIDIAFDGYPDIVWSDGNWSEPAGVDRYAATRRAIVRAAEFIGASQAVAIENKP